MKKFYFLFLFALIASIGNLYAAEKTVTYKFTSKTWEATCDGVAANWTSIKAGSATLSSKGVPVQKKDTGAAAKSPKQFTKIASVKVVWGTSSNGEGSIDLYIENEKIGSQTVSTKATDKVFEVANPSTKDGYVRFAVNCRTSTIYIKSISITYEEVAETKCAKPTFNLTADAIYTDAQTLVITSTTEGAQIEYKIEGDKLTAPITGKQASPATVHLTANGTYMVTATATKEGLDASELADLMFTIAKKCAAPTFTPAAGYLKLGNAITFTSATADAEVYYQYSYNGGEYNSFVKGTSFVPDKEGTYKIIAKATKTDFEDGVSEEQIYEVEDLVFYESFDKNDGTGGNDGKWSGNIAADDIQYDVAGWTFINAKGANKCARIGTGSKGTATTPALTGLDGDAVLTFKAGAWNIEKENTTLNISITNGTLDKTSVVLKKGEFTEYTINITRADATSKIKFEAAEDKNNRFFLDEVKVVAIVKEPKEPTVTLGFTAAEINEMPWLAANDKVLTEEATEVKDASCVKLTCEEGAQIEYTLVSAETGSSTATVESGAEIVGLIKGEVYELTVCAVKGGYKSASRQYTFTITGSTSSVSSMSAEGVKVFAAEGGVKVVADEATDVAVYTVAGQLVRQARVAEGSTLVNVAPGFYVVRANGTATKVIVR